MMENFVSLDTFFNWAFFSSSPSSFYGTRRSGRPCAQRYGYLTSDGEKNNDRTVISNEYLNGASKLSNSCHDVLCSTFTYLKSFARQKNPTLVSSR